MSSILAIARYTITEQIRNRLYLIIILFGAMILGAGLLLGALAPTHKVRVIFDLGLVAIELFGLAAAVFGAVSLVLQEIESKTIYLLLTRPLPRSYYILGRFLGLVVAVWLVMATMAVLHVGAMLLDPFALRLFTEDFALWSTYPVLLLMSMWKMLITAAIALFFSLFGTSAVSALVFTAFFWVAGHFGREMAFLIERSTSGALQIAAQAVALIFPNFQHLNFRDTFSASPAVFDFLPWALAYGAGYAAVFLFLSALLFSRKEF